MDKPWRYHTDIYFRIGWERYRTEQMTGHKNPNTQPPGSKQWMRCRDGYEAHKKQHLSSKADMNDEDDFSEN